MYWFGNEIQESEVFKETSWSALRDLRLKFSKTPLESILSVLDSFSKEWNTDSDVYQEALKLLKKENTLSEDEIIKTLNVLPTLLSKRSLELRIKAELGSLTILDRFTKTPHFHGFVKASPAGVLLHVTAGNVFLSSIDSLIMGFMTKNISLLKVSSSNKTFPLFFAKALKSFDKEEIIADKFSILSWKGGDETYEGFITKKVNTIVAWGGEEMLTNYRKHLPLNVKLLDFGPKISIQVISKEGLENKNLDKVADAIVADITPWNQNACSNPQNIYLEKGIDKKNLATEIEKAFLRASRRGDISEDENVEVLKEYYRGIYSEVMEDGQVLKGEDYLIHLEKSEVLRPSPLNRSLIIKEFSSLDELSEQLEHFSYYLQSCSYLLSEAEKESYLSSLALGGLKRFAPLGTITFGMDGAPHDGRYVLRELVSFVGDEIRVQNFDKVKTPIQTSAKLMKDFEVAKRPAGYIFSSGGTTGNPKFVHFSYEEFDRMTDMLAFNYSNMGIKRGMQVANLFVAGNLWSSFIAVEKALEKVGAIQLPIGGLCPSENIIMYLNKFKPEALLGIPSLLVTLAEQMKGLEVNLKIPKVYYAGEFMSEARKDFLREVWQTESFSSGGYASVDAGVIGYQCPFSKDGEHHIFSDVIDLEIVEGEGIVTSMSRGSLPIKRYATGDRLSWVEGECPCGSKDKKFKLNGRIDNLIQIRSCRISLTDIEKAIKEFDASILNYQIKLTEEKFENSVQEKMEITLEGVRNLNSLKLLELIYKNSRDLKDTLDFESMKKFVELKFVEMNTIKRNQRTGKISLLLDHRH